MSTTTASAHTIAPHADFLVRGSDPVLNGSARFGPTQILNWTFGPVQLQTRTSDGTPDRFGKVRVQTKVENQTAATLNNTRHTSIEYYHANVKCAAESHAHAHQYDQSIL